MKLQTIGTAATDVLKKVLTSIAELVAIGLQLFAAAMVCAACCELLAQNPGWGHGWWQPLAPLYAFYRLYFRASKLARPWREIHDAVLAGLFGGAILLVFDGSFLYAALLAGIASFALFVFDRAASQPVQGDPYRRRGTPRISLDEARKILDRLRPAGDPGLAWGPVQLPSFFDKLCVLVLGSQGSGKTVLILRLMRSLLARFHKSDMRIWAFDAKGSLITAIRELAPSVPVRHIHPFTATGLVWDMARDIQTQRDAQETAQILFPADPNSQVFWDGSAQAILTGAFIGLRELRGDAWDLRDVVNSLSDPDDYRAIVGAAGDSAIARQILKQFFSKDDPRLSANLLATVTQKISPFWVTAARTHHALKNGRGIALTDWLSERSVLVFGHSHRAETAMSVLHQAFFRRFVQLTLDLPNNSKRELWVILDELASCGHLKGLDQLFQKGRERGVKVILGAQEIPPLRQIYGADGCDSILGLCSIVTGLACSDPVTAAWLEKRFGIREYDHEQYGNSSTNSPQGSSHGSSTTWQVRGDPVFLASEFAGLGLVDARSNTGPTGIYYVPEVGAFRGALTMDEVKRELPPPRDGGLTEDPNPALDVLTPWTEPERAALRLQPSNQPGLRVIPGGRLPSKKLDLR